MWEYTYLFLTGPLGIGNESPSWQAWAERCWVCSRMVTHATGLFCSNFGSRRPNLIMCRTAFCGTCYCTPHGIDFFVSRPVDSDGVELEVPAEEMRDFLAARVGDHLCCTFDCDDCAFLRLTRRSPNADDHGDRLLLTLIRRANLDAFWSRRPSTVQQTLRYFGEQVRIGDDLGFEMFTSPGPFPWAADLGMRAAVAILSKSLQPGKHEKFLKFSTLRKLRTVHTMLWVSSAKQLETGSVLDGFGKGRITTTRAPTDSDWFRCFLSGLQQRIGERRKQDLALTPEIVLVILAECENDWLTAQAQGSDHGLREACLDACFFVLTYAAGLRSFEVSKVPLRALQEQIHLEAHHGLPPHIGLPMSGRFKARGNKVQNIVLFLPPTTDSGIESAKWLQRLISSCRNVGQSDGWLFAQEDGQPMGTRHFTPRFYERLGQAYESHPSLFVEGVNILEDYGPVRSGRRGAATQALKKFPHSDKVDLFFRWNTGGQECSSLPMRILYAQQRELLVVSMEVAQCL